jgi:hypothetical protein
MIILKCNEGMRVQKKDIIMTRESFPNFRNGDDSEYPEPPIGDLRGFSQTEADAMNNNQTYHEARTAGRELGEKLAREEEMRQRLGHDGQKDQAHLLGDVQANRRRADQ